ncbi:exonuclease SbcC [Pseudonocardia dioxanivorans CB1190]|uniref:Nuclease SbcCD subunit C n=6 Tax=Pseudonocardia TaxID=1847 RepID=F4CPS6_PSEUX|nr:AAA family ATPase [Pseudonocardia dioxanivorans]AEA26109.1 exonuclease SbcC [Pseudonocardia dioxanivorans CB1190]
MRPVRLEMQGFAAFREPAVVDFTGADYFALVGPTGAGKSTVVDAMCFALYGSVPRWDDRRAVRLALAPSVGRGVVRLVFDVGGERYVAARELRRSAQDKVSVRSARLERLVDAGDAEGDTQVLAADSGVTPEVERLLGLPFDQFCQCVVLPQGAFAEFLHAKPADRQRMLVRLLGLDVYDAIAKEANREAAASGERADVLAGQLSSYDDASDDAVAAATARVEALDALVGRVGDATEELAAAARAVASAEAAVAATERERAVLAGITVPAGAADVDARRRSAADAAAAAARVVADAVAADTAARTARDAAPARGPLERARRDHADLAAARAERPAAAGRLDDAAAEETAASAAVVEAARALEAARADRDAAAAGLAAAEQELARLDAERARLGSLRVPDGLDRLDGRRRAADDDLAAAVKALDEAEAADAAAREARAATPARTVLEKALADHDALDAAAGRRTELAARLEAATAERSAAATALDAAREALVRARAARDAAAQADRAAALRPALHVGDPCPVCEQTVATLPPTVDATALTAAEAGVAAADAELDRARGRDAAAASAADRAAADLARLDTEIAALRGAVGGVADPATLRADLRRLDDVEAELTRADDALRRARSGRDAAAGAVEAVRAEVGRAAAGLRAARDPLVALGAPTVDDEDLPGAWAELAAWARAAAADRDAAAAPARAERAAASAAAERASTTFVAAEAALAAARVRETAAARAEQAARSALAALDGRIEGLVAALADAPPPDEIARLLDRLDTLDADARAAADALRAAHAAAAEATAAATAADRSAAVAWDELRAARDPLVVLGAPAVAGDDLVAAWETLAGWAATAARERDARLVAERDAVTAARARRDQLTADLLDDLGRHELAPPRGTGSAADETDRLVQRAVSVVATEHAKAQAARDRLAERVAEAARLRADRAAAEENQQVARMLGQLLRSDQFPRWLVASALDVLVADASESLAELSGGQFELTHDHGEFVVVDHADADAHRPVKTLSGGETFQASLALALALSAQMSSLAADGAARLDSIFLDEGFGTLDEANLEIVASTLENLAGRGDRMVGVITHVAALAERVPVRFQVSRDQRSATVVREGP